MQYPSYLYCCTLRARPCVKGSTCVSPAAPGLSETHTSGSLLPQQLHRLVGYQSGTELGQPAASSRLLCWAEMGLLCSLPGCSRSTRLQAGRHSVHEQEALCCVFAYPSQRERPSYSLLFIPSLLAKEVNQMSSYYTYEHCNGCQCFACIIVLAIPLYS